MISLHCHFYLGTIGLLQDRMHVHFSRAVTAALYATTWFENQDVGGMI
jgi:hypothetical protein